MVVHTDSNPPSFTKQDVSQQRHLEEENVILKEELQRLTAQLVSVYIACDVGQCVSPCCEYTTLAPIINSDAACGAIRLLQRTRAEEKELRPEVRSMIRRISSNCKR